MIKTSENVLLKDHATTLQDQFQPLLERDKLDDLTRMFTLLSRVPETLARLRDIFESHVKEEGIVAVKKAVAATPESNANGGSGAATPAEEEKGTPVGKRKVGLLVVFFCIHAHLYCISSRQSTTAAPASADIDPQVYMQVLLNVHSKFSSVSESCFKGEAGFVAALDKGCREYVNRNSACKTGSSRSSELLAKYCDGLLRKSSKLTEDSETEKLLSGVVRLVARGFDSILNRRFHFA